MFAMIGGVALLFNFREYGNRWAYREWKDKAVYYEVGYHQSVVVGYEKLYPVLRHNFKFLFEHGHLLNKMERYEESNIILKQGTRYNTDPMFWNIMGNNYLALKQYSQSEAAYLRAYYTCPNRVYPLYLLTKLGAAQGDTVKMEYYGHILLNKYPKVPSLAVDEMKLEIRKMLEP